MFEHRNRLYMLSENKPLYEKICALHADIKDSFPFIVRVAVAIYDPKTKVLKTLLHSSGSDNPLDHYQASLEGVASLQLLYDNKIIRIVNDLDKYLNNQNEHSKKIKEQGYKASYTMPIYNQGDFIGFIFFNANKKNVFTKSVISQIDLYANILSLMIANDLSTIQTLTAAIKTTGNIAHVKDPETGAHIDRVSYYSRIIANALADKYELNDRYIEHIFMFAPLHDIGKIGIPDNILQKPGPLNEDERKSMNTHTTKGGEIITNLINNFGLVNFEDVDILYNIAKYHHEAIDGSGYPKGIKGDEIPLEARIVAVADIFDALTNARYYKEAWSNAKSIEVLNKLSEEKLDKDCVNALIENMDKIEIVQKKFSDI